jgi:hypothetical protein
MFGVADECQSWRQKDGSGRRQRRRGRSMVTNTLPHPPAPLGPSACQTRQTRTYSHDLFFLLWTFVPDGELSLGRQLADRCELGSGRVAGACRCADAGCFVDGGAEMRQTKRSCGVREGGRREGERGYEAAAARAIVILLSACEGARATYKLDVSPGLGVCHHRSTRARQPSPPSTTIPMLPPPACMLCFTITEAARTNF